MNASAPSLPRCAASPPRTLAAAGLLALLALTVYANTFWVPFLLDDQQNILDNPTLRDLSAWREVLSPPSSSTIGGRPVLNLSFAFNVVTDGASAVGFHVVNLLIHLGAGLALFGLVRRTLLLPSLAGRFGGDATRLAFFASALWLVHPLQTNSVTYISQRAESLMGLFYLLTLYGFVRSVDSTAPRLWRAFAVASCFLGIATKEVIATAPLLVLLHDRAFVAGTFGAAWRARRRFYLALAASWLLLPWLMTGITARGVDLAGVITPWRYAWIECGVVLRYTSLALWPHPLTFDYGADFSPPVAVSIAGALVLVPLVALTIVCAARAPRLGFLAACFFLVLAPTSSVVPVTFQPMAENRMYLPLAALAIGAVLITHAGFARRAWPAATLAILALGVATSRRNDDFRDALTITRDTFAKQPDNMRVHVARVVALAEAGQRDAAIAAGRASLRRFPQSIHLHRNLAVLLHAAHLDQEALVHLAAVARLQPDWFDGRLDFGDALKNAGQYPAAVRELEAALKLDPASVVAQLALSEALVKSGRVTEALPHLESAVRRAPDNALAQSNLATALVSVGRAAEALPHFEAAVRNAPDYADAHGNYGLALVSVDRTSDALPHFEMVVRLRPRSADAHFTLANAFTELGRPAEAIAHYEEALRLQPEFPAARTNLAIARAALAAPSRAPRE